MMAPSTMEIMEMDKEYRSFEIKDLDIKIETRDDGKKRIVGHAAVFNMLSEDLGGYREQVAPGAFSEAIGRDDVRALFNHDPNIILGRNLAGTLVMKEDTRGLAIEITPPDTQYIRDMVIAPMERGDVTQMSFAFSILPNGQDWAKDENGQVVRTVKRVKLYDISPVTYPAYPQTDVGLREMRAWQDQQKPVVSNENQVSITKLRARLAESGESALK
jgi:HK97 family phage prohead protease